MAKDPTTKSFWLEGKLVPVLHLVQMQCIPCSGAMEEWRVVGRSRGTQGIGHLSTFDVTLYQRVGMGAQRRGPLVGMEKLMIFDKYGHIDILRRFAYSYRDGVLLTDRGNSFTPPPSSRLFCPCLNGIILSGNISSIVPIEAKFWITAITCSSVA